jgi:hypothetical protein
MMTAIGKQDAFAGNPQNAAADGEIDLLGIDTGERRRSGQRRRFQHVGRPC